MRELPELIREFLLAEIHELVDEMMGKPSTFVQVWEPAKLSLKEALRESLRLEKKRKP